MRELGLVVIFVLGALVLSTAWTSSLVTLFYIACLGIAIGLLVGVPAGIRYHLLLYRALAPQGRLEKGWYWHPLRYDKQLTPPEHEPVLFWCRLGALGFVVLCLGVVAGFICVFRVSG